MKGVGHAPHHWVGGGGMFYLQATLRHGAYCWETHCNNSVLDLITYEVISFQPFSVTLSHTFLITVFKDLPLSARECKYKQIIGANQNVFI